MIDGAKIVCLDLLSTFWAACPLLDFGLIVSESTGEILSQTKEAKRDGLLFRITKQANGGGLCSLLGSLHRYKNGGGNNCDRFTFAELQKVIADLQTKYHINPAKAQIQNLEIGVNIPLEYSPEILIKAAICHKGRAFGTLTESRRRVGKVCEYGEYSFKIYDKSKQAATAGNVLRLEVKSKKQRILEPYGVRTLADLADRRKCFALLGLLLEKINNTIFYDFKFKGGGLSETKQMQFAQYSNPNYWERLQRRQREKARKQYEKLVQKYGLINWRNWAEQKAAKIWLDLFDLQAEKGGHFPQILEAMQAHEKGTFSLFKCLCENVPQSGTAGDVLKAKKNNEAAVLKYRTNLATKKPCFCATCGRDISDQKAGSRFCSELLHGKAARQCRNKESNRRLSIKRKIKRAMQNDLFLSITYTHNGKEYTDILSPKEISLTREWLDKVQKVETLKEPPQTRKGAAARKYLKQLTTNKATKQWKQPTTKQSKGGKR